MATYEITSPDGRKFRVNAPEGASQDEVLSYARQNMPKADVAPDPTEGMSTFDKMAAGAGKAMVDTARGIGQLTGFTSQQEIDDAKRLDAPLMNTGAGIAGNIGGNLATMIAPGALLGAVGRAASLPKLVSAASSFLAPKTVLGGAALGAAMSGAQPVASDESRGFNTALGGVVGGLGTAGANAIGKALSGKAPALTPDQSSLVQRALDLGYELKPSEMTGKRWQQNLEAAMAQMPTTSGRMQGIGAKNQATTNALVDRALTGVGGQIDQPSAAASAVEGWSKGRAAEEGRLGAAYSGLLNGTDVPLENARPALEALRAQQQRLPETSQSGPAMAALNDLLGAPKSPGAGYIRDNSVVPGEIAQNLRSDYTQASSAESTGRDRRLYAAIKDAIDGAIESALPESSKGAFQSINQRYGIYAGLNAISPKQQNVFLNQLYRGSESPDAFYTFLGMAPEGKFKDVARGFVSRIAEGATDTGSGNISAPKIGALVNKANPEALKYFGGGSADLLRDVGNIGRDVLREQTPNSGTTQRLMYQGLLTGSGLGLGGYLGSGQGSPGAVAGSALGAFALPKAVQAAYLSKALRPLLTAGTKGRAAALSEETLRRLLPFAERLPSAGLLGFSQ